MYTHILQTELVLSTANQLLEIAQNRVASGVNVSCTVSLVRYCYYPAFLCTGT